jgi:hypothetical protein
MVHRWLLLSWIVSLVAWVGAATASGSGRLYAGMYVDGFWEHAAIIEAVGAWAGRRLTFSGTFLSVQEDRDNVVEKLEQAWRAHTTPFVNVEVPGSAAAVDRGSFDPYLRDLAESVRAWLDLGQERSLILAPLQEMNLPETPWGCDAPAYVKAFLRIRATFAAAGIDDATRIRWAFAPNGWTSPQCGGRIAPFYPGDDVVDLIGISAYNFGPNEWDGRYRFPAYVFRHLDELRTFAPEKPYLIAQTGTAPRGGDRDAWLREMFVVLAADPNVVGFLYFNKDKSDWGGNEWDWRVFDPATGAGADGLRAGMQSDGTDYLWPLASWFRPGPLPLDPSH